MIDSDPRERRIEWAAASVTQGEILDAFARHCREELDDVEVLTTTPTRLDLAWRRERSSVELAGNLPVHFEWFLRDAYGVKVVASDAFTRGLVDRGIISLGFG